MDQKFRSKLLGSVFAGSLTLLLGGCASFLGAADERRHDLAAGATLRDVAAIIRVADSTRDRGDLVTAAALYRRAHEAAPQDVEPLIRMGLTLSAAGATAEAGQAFRRALRIEPANSEALRGLGLAMLRRNQVDLAIEHFQSALSVDEDARLYNALGVAYDMKNDHQAAQAYYRVGLQVEPANLSLRSNYGLSLSLAGNHRESIEVLSFLASDPMAGPEHRQVLAMAYGLAGDTEAAAQTARIDLGETAVMQNLNYYRSLRDRQLNEAVMRRRP